MQAWALGHCRCWNSQLWLPHLLLPASLPSSISHSHGWTALNLSVFTREVAVMCTAPRCPHRDGTNLITLPCTQCTRWELRRGQASCPPALPQPDIIVLMVYFILINMTWWRALLVPMPLVSGVPERLAGTSRLIPTPPSDRAAIIIPASHGGGGSGNSWRLNISTQGQAERFLFLLFGGPSEGEDNPSAYTQLPAERATEILMQVLNLLEKNRECPPGHRVQKQTSSVERQGHQVSADSFILPQPTSAMMFTISTKQRGSKGFLRWNMCPPCVLCTIGFALPFSHTSVSRLKSLQLKLHQVKAPVTSHKWLELSRKLRKCSWGQDEDGQ